jgi:hypothetical protein
MAPADKNDVLQVLRLRACRNGLESVQAGHEGLPGGCVHEGSL